MRVRTDCATHMTRAVTLVMVVAAIGCATPVESPTGDGEFPIPQIPFAPRTYLVPRVAEPPVIDGRLDDAAWATAPWTAAYVDISGPGHPAPRLATRSKMAWDDTYFYFAAEIEEPHVWATYTARDSIIFHENDWEIFIDPDGDAHRYFELEINALGTVWDLFLVKPYRDGGPALHEWDAPGLRTAVNVHGTVADPSDTDCGWSVEVAWPWASLAAAAGTACPPQPGDRWRVNFSRVEWRIRQARDTYTKMLDPQTGAAAAEDNWVWSPQGLVSMHYPERWGIAEFAADDEPGPLPALTREDGLRAALFEFYYAQRRFRTREGRWARELEEVPGPAITGARWQSMETGWEAIAPLDETYELVIREDGRIRRRPRAR